MPNNNPYENQFGWQPPADNNYGQQPIGAADPFSRPDGFDGFGYVPQPYAQPEQPAYEFKNRWRDRVSMRAVAIGMSALTLAGAGAAAYEFLPQTVSAATEHPGASNGHGQEVHQTSADITPIVKDVPERVRSDFKKALAVDQCKTRVSLEGLMDTYQRLFTIEEQPELSIQDLTVRTQQVSDRLSQTKAEQGFIALPDSFAELEADAEGPQSLSLDKYRQAATDYLEQFGVRALFDWQKQDYTSSTYDDDMARVNNRASPLKSDDVKNSLREHIIVTMKSFASMPPSIVKHPDRGGGQTVRVVAFGNLTGAGDYDGMMIGGGIIIIDTRDTRPDSQELTASASTTHHEITHASQRRICGAMYGKVINGEVQGIDPAYSSFNGSFKYSPGVQALLDEGKTVNGHYGSLSLLGGSGTEVAVARGYGATDVDEDIATAFGEHAIYAPGIESLFSTENDKTILKEKIALSLARLEAADPAAAQYITDMFAVARLKAKILDLKQPLSDRVNSLLNSHYSSPDSNDIDSPGSEFKLLQQKDQELSGLVQRLTQLQS